MFQKNDIFFSLKSFKSRLVLIHRGQLKWESVAAKDKYLLFFIGVGQRPISINLMGSSVGPPTFSFIYIYIHSQRGCNMAIGKKKSNSIRFMKALQDMKTNSFYILNVL